MYLETGRYAGWPANYGIWSWGDEIVVGFTVGHYKSGGGFHERDRTRPFTTMQARSLDGGGTWHVSETPCQTPGGRALSADEHVDEPLRIAKHLNAAGALSVCRGVDFAHPDFALMCARTCLAWGARSWFYTSVDRCRTWDGPFLLPAFGMLGVAARTDYLVGGPAQCDLFLTGTKSNGREGRPFCARTVDGGASFELLSFIGDEPDGHAIMPASSRLADGSVLVAVRTRGTDDVAGCWIDLFASDDGCRSWERLGRAVDSTGAKGNPPTLTQLQDGRQCITYGFRDPPHQICARMSADDGRSWSDTVVLREHAGGGDMGYPRTVQRSDGAMVTVYYWYDASGTDRYISATIWQP